MDYAAIAKANSIPRLNGQQADYIFSRVGQLLDLPSRSSGRGITSLAAQADALALASIADYFAAQPPNPRNLGGSPMRDGAFMRMAIPPIS